MKRNKTANRPLLHLIERNWLASPITKLELLNIAIAERMALEGLRQGGTNEDWVMLRDAAAVTETMALGGAGPEAQVDASASLALLQNLYKSLRPLEEDELKTLSNMLAYHGEQRRLISRSELLVWLKKTVEKFDENRK